MPDCHEIQQHYQQYVYITTLPAHTGIQAGQILRYKARHKRSARRFYRLAHRMSVWILDRVYCGWHRGVSKSCRASGRFTCSVRCQLLGNGYSKSIF